METIDKIVTIQMEMVQYLSGRNLWNKNDEYGKDGELSGDDISRMITKMSTYNVYLGLYIAEFDFKINMMEAERKNCWADFYSKQRSNPEIKITQKDAEIAADEIVSEAVNREIETKRQLVKIKNLRADCKDLVASLQSRLNQLKQERIEASMVPNPK